MSLLKFPMIGDSLENENDLRVPWAAVLLILAKCIKLNSADPNQPVLRNRSYGNAVMGS